MDESSGKMECLNCGIRGHTFRECRLPVMSYGVIAVKFVDTTPQYLMIRRRDSLAYVEFMRGKYKPTNHEYIQLLCNEMTVEERGRLLRSGFTELWHNLWNGQRSRQFRNEADTAKTSFDRLTTTGDSHGKTLPDYIAACTHTWTEPEWGFPKGRRNLHELDRTCAVREWREETGLPEHALHLLTESPYDEEYVGSNGIPYKQVYFLGACLPSVEATMHAENAVMTREIGGISWVSFEEALSKIRHTNAAKRDLLTQLHRRITMGDLRTKLQAALPSTILNPTP